jgi:hypothetical protein
MLSFTVVASQTTIKFPSVANNVAYSKVAALAFTAADKTISYVQILRNTPYCGEPKRLIR